MQNPATYWEQMVKRINLKRYHALGGGSKNDIEFYRQQIKAVNEKIEELKRNLKALHDNGVGQ